METNNKQTIVFILASDDNTNNIKRIEEFLDNNYDVKVYSFKRRETLNKSNRIPFEIIGTFSNDLSYIKRIRLMISGIRYVLNSTKNTKCIYYLVRNDVAIIFNLLSNKPFIFEEADMTHLSLHNKYVRSLMEFLVKKIINKSRLSVFRSEGFIKYHFGDTPPGNTFVIPNRLDKKVLNLPIYSKKPFDANRIRFGFVGGIRYESIVQFVTLLMDNFKQHEFHFYGDFVSPKIEKWFDPLKKYDKCFFHGRFQSPNDLAQIYSQIDVLLSTYDANYVNVRFAEPNKLYESIYYRTPIIVSSNTFLGEKVKSLNIG